MDHPQLTEAAASFVDQPMPHAVQMRLPDRVPAERGRLLRCLAALQLIKDTLTILKLNVLLIFAIVVPIAVPGLVLYVWRWKLASSGGSTSAANWHWALTLVHEVLCAWLFVNFSSEPMEQGYPDWGLLAAGYVLGSGIAGAALWKLWIGNIEEPLAGPVPNDTQA